MDNCGKQQKGIGVFRMNSKDWLNHPNEWQFIDPSNGYIFPWLVLDCLEYLVTLDISNWRVFESGCGAGTLWWAVKCKEVVTLETNPNWIDNVRSFAMDRGIDNIEYHLVDAKDPNVFPKYVNVLANQIQEFDAIIIDGLFRDEMSLMADGHICDGGVLIADNYKQTDVWPCMKYETYLNSRYSLCIFHQSPITTPECHPWICQDNASHFPKLRTGHPDWKTAFWTIKK